MEEKELINEEETLKEEVDWKDSYLRLLADFENYKKRASKEKEEIKSKTKIETLGSILELDNDIHIATKMIKDEKSLSSINILTDKLNRFLKINGIEEVQTDIYDSDLHEVISVVETGKEEVIDVVSKGYTMNGKIVKYPKIILSK
jgi:molecular chaperone GrpE